MNDTWILISIGSVSLVALTWLGAIVRKARLRHMFDMVFLRVLLPRKDSDSDEKKETSRDFKEQVALMEQLLASLRQMNEDSILARAFKKRTVSLEIVASNEEIYFYVVVPRKMRLLVEKQITGFYSDAVVEETLEMDVFENKRSVRGVEIMLKKPFFEPIKTYQKLESDPINPLLGTLGKLSKGESAVVQVLLSPVQDTWQAKSFKYEKKLSKKHASWNIMDLFSRFLNGIPDEAEKSHDGDEEHASARELVKEKAKKSGFSVSIRIIAGGQDDMLTESIVSNLSSAFLQYASPGFNAFKSLRPKYFDTFVSEYACRSIKGGLFSHKQVLTTEEIASLYHFPHSKYNRSPEIKWQNFKMVKAPVNIPKDGILLGYNQFQGISREIRIKNEDRFRHFYVIGQTGTGKSSILQVMARQDIAEWRGVAVMDPHGDLANDLLPFVPRSRADDVIYFDPADMARPMGINILEASTDDEKQMVAQDALNIMIKLFGPEIFGPRIQDYFRNGVLTLMDFPGGAALTDVLRLFTDDTFQKERRQTVKDPVVRAWWDYTFAKMGEREKGEIIPYFAAKFGGFITNKLMRNIIGQTKSSFDIFDSMQSGKILFVNLSKGVLGDFNSTLLGLVLVSKIQMAAMRRQTMDKSERKDFFLYIDEFQNYITESIESILSEARKYRLGLTVAHQYLWQLQKSDALTKSNVNLKDAIFGNVGSIMSYKVGPEDAEFLAKQFAPAFSDQDLINMDKFKWIMKLAVDGQPTTAFSITPVNPYLKTGDKKLANAYKELSRLKYGREREFVEREINFRIGAV